MPANLVARPERSRKYFGPVDKQRTWPPLLAAVEGPTGTWRMVAPDGREYGSVELRRVSNGAETRYKAIYRGEILGWSTTLREACDRIHMAFLAAHGPGGSPMADWGDPYRRQRHGAIGSTS